MLGLLVSLVIVGLVLIPVLKGMATLIILLALFGIIKRSIDIYFNR